MKRALTLVDVQGARKLCGWSRKKRNAWQGSFRRKMILREFETTWRGVLNGRLLNIKDHPLHLDLRGWHRGYGPPLLNHRQTLTRRCSLHVQLEDHHHRTPHLPRSIPTSVHVPPVPLPLPSGRDRDDRIGTRRSEKRVRAVRSPRSEQKTKETFSLRRKRVYGTRQFPRERSPR